MTIEVWVDAWQLQCCGDSFDVGGAVSWRLVPADPDWLVSLLGEAAAQRIRFSEEHHNDDPAITPTPGTIRSIRSVSCELAPRDGGEPGVLYPVPGSAQVRAVQRADGHPPAGGAFFVGYVVDLSPAGDGQVSPPGDG